MSKDSTEIDSETQLIELSWDDALGAIAKSKHAWSADGEDPFPGAPHNGVIRFDYLYALALRLKEEAEMVSVSPWIHHMQMDLQIKRNGILDRRTVITAHPKRENWYRVTIVRKPAGMPHQSEMVGFFDLEDSIRAIKNTLRILQNEP